MLKPTNLLKAAKMKDTFAKNHPDFMLFLKQLQKQALKQGSSIEILVHTSDGKTLNTMLKIEKEDEEIINLFL